MAYVGSELLLETGSKYNIPLARQHSSARFTPADIQCKKECCKRSYVSIIHSPYHQDDGWVKDKKFAQNNFLLKTKSSQFAVMGLGLKRCP